MNFISHFDANTRSQFRYCTLQLLLLKFGSTQVIEEDKNVQKNIFGQLLCQKKKGFIKMTLLPLILTGEKNLKAQKQICDVAWSRRIDTGGVVHIACFSVILEYFRIKYRDNVAF